MTFIGHERRGEVGFHTKRFTLNDEEEAHSDFGACEHGDRAFPLAVA